jgi:hypothetical protein
MSALWIGAICAFIWVTLFFYFCLSALANLRKDILNLTEQQQRQR